MSKKEIETTEKKVKKPKTKKYDVEAYKKNPPMKSYAERVFEQVYKDKLPPWLMNDNQ